MNYHANKKTTMQVFNETEALDEVYRSDAAARQREAGILYGEKHTKEQELPASLPEALKQEPRVRKKLSEVTGVPQQKLETSVTSSYNVIPLDR